MNGETVLTVRMHGWRAGVRRADASRQIFWVFEQAGVRNVLVEGGVGVINSDFALRDFIIPDDYIDFSMRKDVSLSDKYLLIMRDPVCPDSRRAPYENRKENSSGEKSKPGGLCSH